MERIQSDIRKLISYGVGTGLVPREDVVYTTNRLLELFGLEELQDEEQGGQQDEQGTTAMEAEELEEVLNCMCRDRKSVV